MRSFTFSNVAEMRIEFWVRTQRDHHAPIYVGDEVMAVKLQLFTIPGKRLDWPTVVKMAQKAVNAHTAPRTFSIKTNIFRAELIRGTRATYNRTVAKYVLHPIRSRVAVLVELDSMGTARDLQKLSSRKEVAVVPFTNAKGKSSGGKLLSTLNYHAQSKLRSAPTAIDAEEKGVMRKTADAVQSLWSKVSPSITSSIESLRSPRG